MEQMKKWHKVNFTTQNVDNWFVYCYDINRFNPKDAVGKEAVGVPFMLAYNWDWWG